MKVCIIAEVLGEPNNGTSIAAYDLIDALRKKGHEVRVVCPDRNRIGESGYFVLPVRKFIEPIQTMLKNNNVVIAKFDKNVIYEAIADADIVHIMIPLFISRKTSKYVKSLGIPLTAGFHAQSENFASQIGMLRCKAVNHLIYKWYDGNLFGRADGIHYPTQFIRDVFEKEVHRETPGYVISNGVSTAFKPMQVEKPAELKDKFSILFTGRLSKEKNHMVLLEAVALSKYNEHIQLVFAGQGPLKGKIEKYSKHHLVNSPIINFYSREELVRLINSVDLYCHPSYAEIEAISCMEAIACGKPALIANSSQSATKNFALDESCLFRENDAADLSRKIDYFYEHRDELEILGKKYLESSSKFSLEYCMDRMEEMMKQVIESSHANKN